MPLANWPGTRKKIPSRTIREFKGINKLDTYSIRDEYAADMIKGQAKFIPLIRVISERDSDGNQEMPQITIEDYSQVSVARKALFQQEQAVCTPMSQAGQELPCI
ncbi:hypothetical protein [Paenibacillus silvisoli]|uniref:hypothetical protein n=1 Tax=Paenibacillus silvisoli TaxID=3110539 RepID=UPI002805DED6|nr:hypothetical protein [Paenibacillus silvisoli]